jgi:hypothetical protein
MAQGKGGTENGREIGHLGEEEHRSNKAAGTPDILRMGNCKYTWQSHTDA